MCKPKPGLDIKQLLFQVYKRELGLELPMLETKVQLLKFNKILTE